MNASISCSCGCSPCVCATPPVGLGCLSEACVPRPCFFEGQLVTSDDLNAIVAYFRNQESLLAKLAAGWGVLGGMRLLQASRQSAHAASDLAPPPVGALLAEILPNPQITTGHCVHVSAGAALDAAGRMLTLCSPQTLDLLALSKGVGVPQETHECSYWLGDLCDTNTDTITAAQYWVVAELDEMPARPVPRFAGGGACEPETACDFSRRLENVRIRLVHDLPLLYFLHGCLDRVALPALDQLIALAFGNTTVNPAFLAELGGMTTPAIADAMAQQIAGLGTTGANEAVATIFSCLGFKFVPQVFEYLNQIAATTCCTRPGAALGRVLLASQVPDSIRGNLPAGLPWYTLIDDGFPYRRLVPNAASNQTLLGVLLSVLVCQSMASGSTGGTGGGGTPA